MAKCIQGFLHRVVGICIIGIAGNKSHELVRDLSSSLVSRLGINKTASYRSKQFCSSIQGS